MSTRSLVGMLQLMGLAGHLNYDSPSSAVIEHVYRLLVTGTLTTESALLAERLPHDTDGDEQGAEGS